MHEQQVLQLVSPQQLRRAAVSSSSSQAGLQHAILMATPGCILVAVAAKAAAAAVLAANPMWVRSLMLYLQNLMATQHRARAEPRLLKELVIRVGVGPDINIGVKVKTPPSSG
jgi:hypothetical protein